MLKWGTISRVFNLRRVPIFCILSCFPPAFNIEMHEYWIEKIDWKGFYFNQKDFCKTFFYEMTISIYSVNTNNSWIILIGWFPFVIFVANVLKTQFNALEDLSFLLVSIVEQQTGTLGQMVYFLYLYHYVLFLYIYFLFQFL